MPNGQSKPATNVITRRYKDGSIIYFEGDRSDYVYILKSGRIVLSFIKIETGEEMKEMIKVGEFFGVKSAIGKYPREETAQTIGDTVVLAVNRADFEKMILKNVALVTKMLRVFSNQLRRLGKAQREILGDSDSINPADELFKIGEYYYKTGRSQQALYSYKRYLEHYPGTKFSRQAMQRIRAIETGEAEDDIAIDATAPGESPGESITEELGGSGDFDMTDFSLDDEDSGAGGGGMDSMEDFGEPAADSGSDFGDDSFSLSDSDSASDDADDFFSGDDKSLDDFSFDEEPEGKEEKDISEMFYEAVSLFSQENYEEALEIHKKILETKSLKDDSERKIFEKSHFEVGRCYLKLSNVSEAVNSLTAMIKKFPRSDLVKNAIYHMGLAFEIAKKPDKARTYYNKVISMEPRDSINKLATKRLNSIK